MSLGRSERFDFWKMKVAMWRKIYPPPAAPLVKGQFNPASVRTALTCAKCGSPRKVKRHHKGHEFLFAVIMPERYAARYVEFHPEDTVPLCDKHHKVIHRMYEPIIANVKAGGKDMTFEQLEAYRVRLVLKCNRWLMRKVKRT